MTGEDIFMNLGISVVSSIIAAGGTIYLQLKKTKKKYSEPIGEYFGYGLTQADGDQLHTDPQSEVSIKYLSENKLLLTLKEINHPHQWSGIIAMETESYGTISWRYDILHGKPVDLKTHRFGFKRMMFLRAENKKVIYLVGEGIFGKEILIQKPKA